MTNPGKAGSDKASSDTVWDFYFFVQKKCLLPGGIFIFFPLILKLEVGFFSAKKSFSHNG